MRLKKQAWDAEKIRKRTLKHDIFVIFSFLIANVFLAYLIGSDRLIQYIIDGPFSHMGTLIPLIIFTAVFYFDFAWFREQFCVIACTNGRLQGVLLDTKSVVVAYDYKRGEGPSGRKKFRKNEDRDALGHGDCIDCNQCVNVCPTGIDIRNGTQLECVNCTACIDECDHIMESINLPKGLIRYASEDNIKNKVPFKLSARMKGYIAVLSILIGILTGMLFLRNDVEANVLRLPGQLYEHKENNIISNVFTYKLVNKTTKEIEDVSLKLTSHKGTLKLVATSDNFTVPKKGIAEGTLFIEINNSALTGDRNKIKIGVYVDDKLIETCTANFLGPRSYK